MLHRRTFSKSLLRRATAMAACLLLSAVPAFSQAKAQLTGVRIDATDRVELTHTIPAPIRMATDLGQAPDSLPMKDMLLLLAPTSAQKKALETFLSQVQNPSSPNYHQWLTPTQFGQLYAPAQADIDTVKQWLESQGFTVNQVATSHAWIRFSGTASMVQSAFGAQIHSYKIDGRSVYSNATEVTLPRALTPVVSSVLSLNNYEKRALHTSLRTVARSATGKLVEVAKPTTPALPGSVSVSPNAILPSSPAFTTPGQPETTLLAPGDFSKIYDTGSLISGGNDGTGVSIAIVGRSDISLSDIEAFRTIFALPFNDPTIINANDDPGVVPGDDEEAILDTEWSGAVAPHAQIKYVVGGTTTTTDGVDISAAYIVDNRIAPIMSVSFGLCEQALAPAEQQFYYNMWQQAAAEGISVLVSSDDAGASGCAIPDEDFATKYGFGVNGLASTPYDTAVGGTEFNDPITDTYWSQTVNADQSSAKGYIPEAVWNESCNPSAPTGITNCYFNSIDESTFASGGGASTCSTHSDTATVATGLYTCTSGYPKPSWQTGTGVPNDGERDVPDVALAAAAGHDGFLLCYNGSCQYAVNPDGSILLEAASIIGGTSAASPSMAALLALVEQKNGQFQGLLNPKLYALSAAQTGSCDSSAQTDPTQDTSCVFHDVTLGSNTLTCAVPSPNCTLKIPNVTDYKQLPGWAAGTGYDLATGLGSVDAVNLVAAWSKLTQAPTTTTLTLSSTTFMHGTPINVTATTAPTSGSGTPSGAIDLTAAGSTSQQGPVLAEALTNGSFTGSVATLPGGTYQLTAQYGGDASFGSSTSAPVSVKIAAEPSVITATSLVRSNLTIHGFQPIVPGSATGLNSQYFLNIQLSGTSGAGIPSGTVTITETTNNQPVGTFPVDSTGLVYVPCGPNTSCDFPIGSYKFKISYSGDSSFQPSTATLPFAITRGRANWFVNASAQNISTGTLVVATVDFEYDPAQQPTGTVILVRDDTNATLGTAQIGSGGTAVITFHAPAGSYAAKAVWTGDANYFPGYDLFYPDLVVTDAGTKTTTTTMTVATPSSAFGQSTSFVITVASTNGNTTQPTGTVALYSPQYGQISNSVNLVGGATTLFVQWPVTGNLSVYAAYSGDTKYAGSSSASTSITIAKATPSILLSTRAPYVTTGGQASITASLVSVLSSTTVSAPTGSIQFFDSLNGGAATAIGNPQALNTGNGGSLIATIAPVLAAGTHTITAVYSGDSNWNTTSSAPVSIVSTSPDFTLTGPSNASITAGQSASIALNTTSILGYVTPAAVACTGTLPEGITCGTATVTPGSSTTLNLTAVAPGTVAVAALHGRSLPWEIPGTLTFAGIIMLVLPRRRRALAALPAVLIASVAMTFFVTGCGGAGSPSSASLTLTSTNTKVAAAAPVVLSATVASSRNATGTVTFMDAGTSIGTGTLSNGVATLTTSQLSVGTHAITAAYAGDNNNLAASSADTLEQTITGNFTLSVVATSGSITHTSNVLVALQ
jgi:subtilase family serine protease